MKPQGSPAKDAKTRPSLRAALSLHCPYCHRTPLRKQGSWFVFRRGCRGCDFRYEREAGYYTGASWMVAYPMISLCGLGTAVVFKLWLFPELNTLLLITLVSALMVALAILSTPFCKAIWLYQDHWFHPLDKDDSYDRELY